MILRNNTCAMCPISSTYTKLLKNTSEYKRMRHFKNRTVKTILFAKLIPNVNFCNYKSHE